MTAPLLVVPLACKAAYLDHYAEPDKGWTDRAEGRWPVPYWCIDTGFATLLMLLTAVDAGLGGLFFACRRRRSRPCGSLSCPCRPRADRGAGHRASPPGRVDRVGLAGAAVAGAGGPPGPLMS